MKSAISPRGNAPVGDALSLGGFVIVLTKAPLRSVLANKKRRKPMSHNVVPPLKSPAPPADEVMSLWKRLKRLGTRLSTEEIFGAEGTTKRVTRVRRSGRM
jgi:hypothetical protein